MAFESLQPQPADPLLQIIGAFRADPRADKIDLGVGVFRDPQGATPVMRAIKVAERRLVETQPSKSYLGSEGDTGFVAALASRVIGGTVAPDRVQGVQTPGGTGALRLGAELLARAGVPRIWIAAPSWANHAPIFAQTGVAPQLVPAFDIAAQRFDADAFVGALAAASAGDAVLLHGCCHNPTGIDPTAEEWTAIAATVAERGLVPFIDLAYQGLGDGFDADAAGARAVLAAVPWALLAYSCDKNFALYRERTGALYAVGPDATQSATLQSNLLALARTNWSMPPDHGAAAVRLVLEDAALATDWAAELESMRRRLVTVRTGLAALGRIGTLDLAPLAAGKGLFATLPVSPTQVGWLRETHAIYMAGSGRINVAGFTSDAAIERFGAALAAMAAGGVA